MRKYLYICLISLLTVTSQAKAPEILGVWRLYSIKTGQEEHIFSGLITYHFQEGGTLSITNTIHRERFLGHWAIHKNILTYSTSQSQESYTGKVQFTGDEFFFWRKTENKSSTLKFQRLD